MLDLWRNIWEFKWVILWMICRFILLNKFLEFYINKSKKKKWERSKFLGNSSRIYFAKGVGVNVIYSQTTLNLQFLKNLFFTSTLHLKITTRSNCNLSSTISWTKNFSTNQTELQMEKKKLFIIVNSDH